MDIDEAAAELYAGPPEAFTARRGELAAAARKGGDTAAAKEIGRLRRPTVSAWCLNVLVAGQDDALADVFEVAEALRRAQAALDAARMAELSTRRRALVGQVQRRAAEVARAAGQSLSAGAQREVEETLAAVVASEDAAAAVASGRLTRSLSYAGFGDVDLSGATATPLRSVPRPALDPEPEPEADPEAELERGPQSAGRTAGQASEPGERPRRPRRAPAEATATAQTAPAGDLRLVPSGGSRARKGPPPRTAADRAADRATEAAAAATAQVEEARAAVEAAARALAEANQRAEAAAEAVRRLHDELAQARADAAAAARAVATAERRHASAEVTLGTAERRLRGTGRSRPS